MPRVWRRRKPGLDRERLEAAGFELSSQPVQHHVAEHDGTCSDAIDPGGSCPSVPSHPIPRNDQGGGIGDKVRSAARSPAQTAIYDFRVERANDGADLPLGRWLWVKHPEFLGATTTTGGWSPDGETPGHSPIPLSARPFMMKTWASRRVSIYQLLSSSSRRHPLNDSIQAFFHGEVVDEQVPTALNRAQSSTAAAMNCDCQQPVVPG